MGATEELGRTIAGISNEQARMKENMMPDDVDQQLLLFNGEAIKINLEVIGHYNIISSTSFVLDHPVYGELDSSTLQLDGGYTSTSTVAFTYNS